MTVVLGVTMPIGPILIRYLPAQFVIAIGTFIALFGIFLSTFTTSLTGFVMFYAVPFAVGIGVWYLVPLVWGWEYYGNHKGFVSGVIIGAYGFGAFLFSYISFIVANPHNAVPMNEVEGGSIFSIHQPESDNAPRMLRVCTLLWMILSFIAVWLVEKMPKREGMQEEGLVQNEENDEDTIEMSIDFIPFDELSTIHYPTFWDGMKEKQTFYIWWMAFLGCCYSMFMANVFKSYGDKYIKNDVFVTTVGAAGAIWNGLSRPFWATLQDKYGFKKVYFILLIIKIPVAFTMPFARMFPLLYLIWICLTFVTLGGQFSIFPTLCGKIYGPRTGSLIYSVLYSGFMLSVFLGLIFTRLLLNSLGYNFIIYLTAFMAIGSLGILHIFKEDIILSKALQVRGVQIRAPRRINTP
jgi:OFA family oxalate/formate antiporter-like MFS transporter